MEMKIGYNLTGNALLEDRTSPNDTCCIFRSYSVKQIANLVSEFTNISFHKIFVLPIL